MEQNNRKKISPIWKVISVLLALAAWQMISMLPTMDVLLASPVDVLRRLFTIWREPGFFGSVLFSFGRIAGGFGLALVLGVLLAIPAGRFPIVETLLSPYMLTVKSVPVASFVIIVLIFLPSERLSTIISFLMVLPVIYTNLLTGIKSTSRKLEEMATVYHLPWYRRLFYVRLPQISPYFLSGCSVALGLCWKSGIAAELIGMPSGSIGEALYQAKIYLNTADLFCWTIIIILISLGFEKLVTALIRLAFRGVEKTV